MVPNRNRDRDSRSKPGFPKPIRDSACDPDSDSDDSGVLLFYSIFISMAVSFQV